MTRRSISHRVRSRATRRDARRIVRSIAHLHAARPPESFQRQTLQVAARIASQSLSVDGRRRVGVSRASFRGGPHGLVKRAPTGPKDRFESRHVRRVAWIAIDGWRDRDYTEIGARSAGKPLGNDELVRHRGAVYQ